VKSLRVLQEDVPPAPFSSVCAIIESDVGLGRPISSLFSSIDETPLGAASIGQVHKATLLSSGRECVVKVQYPEAERFFGLDFSFIRLAFRFYNPQLLPVLDAQRQIFAAEFDYEREARNLRLVGEAARGRDFNGKGGGTAAVKFPEPYDGEGAGEGEAVMVAKKCFVMTKCGGETVTKVGERMLREIAGAAGMEPEEFKRTARARMIEEGKKAEGEEGERKGGGGGGGGRMGGRILSLATRGLGSTAFAAIRAAIVARDCVRNAPALLRNCTLGALGGRRALYSWSFVPPDGPRLMTVLFNEKAFEIFSVGKFQADGHAGNIMIDQKANEVSLLDYGQLVELTDDYRENFARYIVALDKGDREEVRKRWILLGNEFTWRPPGGGADVVNPVNETFACALFHFGGAAGMRKGMELLKFKNVKEAVDDLGKKREARKIDITKTSPEYGMLQRACFCLAGVGVQVGAGSLSAAEMMRPGAEEFLRGLEIREKKKGKEKEKAIEQVGE